MRRSSLLLAALVALPHTGSPQSAPASARRVRHSLQVTLDPKAHRLQVSDHITLPEGSSPEFLLNGNLKVTKSEPAVAEIPLGETEKFFGINASDANAKELRLKRYRAAGQATSIRVSYEGAFDFGLGDQKEEY